jgi:hypothetical protein
LKIRTSSLPLFGTNETVPMISPPIVLPSESRTSSIEPSTNVNPFIFENKQTTEIIDSTNRVDQPTSSSQVKIKTILFIENLFFI